MLIVLNALSGAAVIRRDPRATFAERLPDAVVHESREGEDLAEAVARRMEAPDPPTVLGVYGGDGTVSRIADLARRYEVPLLAMPGGTFNHFVRALGIDDVDAAIDAYQRGAVRTVTVARAVAGADEAIVLNAVSIGTYPTFLEQREERFHRLGKWLGGVAAAWSALRTARPVTIVRNGRRARVWSVFVGVGRNDPRRVATMQRQSIDDAVLDVRIHHARGTRLRAMASLAFGRRTAAVLRALRMMPPESDVERLVLARFEIAVRPADGVPSVFVHDGELEEQHPSGFTLQCEALPSAVTVFAPPA